MWYLLAQVDWEQAGGAAVVVIAALGGQRGLEALITAWRGKHRAEPKIPDGFSAKFVPQTECDLRHARDQAVSKNLAESIDRLNASITRLHDRIDRLSQRE